MQFDKISRAQALAEGRKRFYTGKPCKRGHDAQRFVTTGGCVACNASRAKVFSQAAQAASTARVQGLFAYPLRPEDFAAALAYCQALDLAAGRTPHTPGATKPPPPAKPFDVEAARRHAFMKATQFADRESPNVPYLPAP